MSYTELYITRGELMQANRSMAEGNYLASPAETQRYVLHRMKRAGIPVMGDLFLLDVTRGKLTVEKRDSGWKITWRD